MSRLETRGLALGYGGRPVLHDLTLAIPDGKVTCIIGPNGCGKSTLLRALARVVRPTSGAVLLDGRPILQQPTRAVARVLGLLPQSPIAPDGITAFDLVARGRSPHQTALRQWSEADERAVLAALGATGTLDLADARVDELSGGQRQRIWIAMALAQETDLLLLDEPTTYLDLRHQVEILSLVRRLNRARGRTIVMVLHDIGLAARYADRLVAMRDGRIVAEGAPRDLVTPAMLEDVFAMPAQVIADPVTGSPIVVPEDPP